MKTVSCWWCDEFSTRGPKRTGYCNQEMKPTWPSVFRKCQAEIRVEAGEFCWNCCPFIDDHEGAFCGDHGPTVKSIDDCSVFTHRLNEALGGHPYYGFYYLNNRAEVVEVETGYLGVCEMVDRDLTIEYRWHVGWSRPTFAESPLSAGDHR